MTTFNDDEVMHTSISVGRSPAPPSTPDDIAHYVVGMEGAASGRRFEVGDTPLTIGRDAKQTLVFADDPEVSRVHARLLLQSGRLVLEDLGSTNGTFLGTTRIARPTAVLDGQVLRVGRQLLKYERRSRREVERSQELDRDLLRASAYVRSLLPAPLDGPVKADCYYLPSAALGGDALGYYWLDPGTFVFYLVDVSGHGVGSAMHSVSVLNVLRQRALPGIDFADPAAVLSSLNDRFQMDGHNGMYFTIWYGVYRPTDRTLVYGSAGHHPAFLVAPDRREAIPLGDPALMIGAIPGQVYGSRQHTLPPDSSLYVFSDGVFEVLTPDGRMWTLSEFLPALLAPPTTEPEPERLYRVVKQVAAPDGLNDDFSLLTLTFR